MLLLMMINLMMSTCVVHNYTYSNIRRQINIAQTAKSYGYKCYNDDVTDNGNISNDRCNSKYAIGC